jgi:hypothetical protein
MSFWETAGKFASIVTAIIALAAACIAWRAINAQRDIARRRAAIDFFLKTEMDEKVIELYREFEQTTPKIREVISQPTFGPQSPEHHVLRKWLNICELIAVGVNKGAFSESVSLDYWGDVLPASFNDAKPYIDHVRGTLGMGGPLTFNDLQVLCVRWRKYEQLSPAQLRRQLDIDRR